MTEQEEIREEIEKLIKVRRWGSILLDCGKDGFIITHEKRLFRFLEKGGDLQEFIQGELAYKGTERFKTLEEGLEHYQNLDQAFEGFLESEKKHSLGKEAKKTEIIKSDDEDIILDRTVSYLGYETVVNPSKIEIRGPWSDTKAMIINFVLLKMLETAGTLKEDQLALYKSIKEIKDYCEDMAEYEKNNPTIFDTLAINMEIDPSELRERFNIKDKITNKEICKEALDIPGIYFVGKARIYYDKKRRHFENILFSESLASVKIRNTDKKERHTGELKYRIVFQFYTGLGVTMVANLLNAPINKTLDTFYRLLPARRNIYSAMRLKKSDPCHFSEQELLDLAGIKDTNPRRARQRLAKHLDKLKDNEWVKRWEKKKGKYRFSYTLWG